MEHDHEARHAQPTKFGFESWLDLFLMLKQRRYAYRSCLEAKRRALVLVAVRFRGRDRQHHQS